VHVQPVSNDEAEVAPPSVTMNGDVMTVSGIVKRKPDYNGPLDGHVKIEFLDGSQKVIDQFPIEWNPSEVPLNGNRQAGYKLEYGWLPPEGTTVRISVVEDTDEVLQTEGGNATGMRTGGNPEGVPSGVHTPRPTGTPRRGMAPGTPGMSRQGTASPSTPGSGRSGRGRR
jgi:hypothetical protein